MSSTQIKGNAAFDNAWLFGIVAAEEGLPIGACPYPDIRWPGGHEGITSIFRDYWLRGHKFGSKNECTHDHNHFVTGEERIWVSESPFCSAKGFDTPEDAAMYFLKAGKSPTSCEIVMFRAAQGGDKQPIVLRLALKPDQTKELMDEFWKIRNGIQTEAYRALFS